MPLIADSMKNLASALTVAALLIAALVLGRDILVPLTLAVIITFILSPVIRKFVSYKVPRSLAVGLTVAATTVLIGSLATLFSSQMLDLASDIGQYRSNISEKVKTITGAGSAPSSISRAAKAIESVGDAIGNELNSPSGLDKPDAAGKVVVSNTSGAGPFATALTLLESVSKPVAQAALTFLFAIFLLLQHQDLSDRVVRVIGTDRMSDTTSAMSEAGTRLSQLFLTQALLNGGFGAFVGVVLWAAGVPNPVLWGVATAILRFIPFIGSFLSAVPPLLLAAAVDPGWTTFLITLTLYAVGEPIMGHLVEPLVLGKRAGISPFAMVASVSFWTLVWGPVGLLLAAPLTTVLIVMGRYIRDLEFFSVLLGDEPALSPEQEFYHRLLSGDPYAAADALRPSEDASAAAANQQLVLNSLSLAARDLRAGALDPEQVAHIEAGVKEIVHGMTASPAEGEAGVANCKRVLVVPARGPIDKIAASFVASHLTNVAKCEATVPEHGGGLLALGAAAQMSAKEAAQAAIIVSAGTLDSSQIRHLEKRAIDQFGDDNVVVLEVRNSDRGISNTTERPKSVLRELSELTARMALRRSSEGPRRPPPQPIGGKLLSPVPYST